MHLSALVVASVLLLASTSAFLYEGARDFDYNDGDYVRAIEIGGGIGLQVANQICDGLDEVTTSSSGNEISFESKLSLDSKLVSKMGLDSSDGEAVSTTGVYNDSRGLMDASILTSVDGQVIDDGTFQGSPVVYDDGTFDLFFVANDELVSLADLIGNAEDLDDCSLFVGGELGFIGGIALAIPGVNVAAVALLVVLVIVCVVVIELSKLPSDPGFDPHNPYRIVRDSNTHVPISVWVDGTKYDLKDASTHSSKKPGNFYVAYLDPQLNKVVISTMNIGIKVARNIMKLGDLVLNVYTVNQKDAKHAADIEGLGSIVGRYAPYWESAHGIGYFDHWHTYKLHPGDAHSFHGAPKVG